MNNQKGAGTSGKLEMGRPSPGGEEFAKQAEGRAGSFLAEFWYFLRHNKKWWLTPIFILLLLFGVLVILGGSGAAPFIYTLF